MPREHAALPVPTRREIAAAYDEIADEYTARRPMPWPETYAFERRLRPGASVLDLGCGGGRNLVFFAQRGHPVVGLDASGALLRNTAAKAGSGRLVRGDAVRLPFRPRSFDAVHCVAILHHLPSEAERRQAVEEVVRVLRPGGLVMVSVWALDRPSRSEVEGNRSGDAPSADVFVPWHRADGHVVQRFYHLFREGELAALLTNAGLELVDSRREGDNHVVVASAER